MRELLILFGVLIGWVLGYVFRLYMPKKRKEEELAFQRELSEAKDTIRRLETQLSQYQHLQEQLNACEAQLQQKTEELEDYNAKFTSAETRIETLQQHITSLEQKIQAATGTPAAEIPSETGIEIPMAKTSPEVEEESSLIIQPLISPIEAPTAIEEEIPQVVEPETPPEEAVEEEIPREIEPVISPIEAPPAVEEEIPQVVEPETPPEEAPPVTATEIEPEVEAETPTEKVMPVAETELQPEAVRLTPEKIDNLRKIEGIGPKVEQLLNEAGILTFEQLARTEVERLRAILEGAGGIFKAMDPASWPEQAGLAARGDWEALKTLQDQLDGGRYKS
ncbi:hypothetical protein U27_01454 [Candidatus Vecturithrix granuli]|uniref:DUF4332 domain-containing protein n=1 Tax=Vecturithrix granuli TaxID=1499967 RepID=A0A081CAE8_VECG1|nr:hypothetical protein U27_01454 [Candidatus Vecturithrix granuli]